MSKRRFPRLGSGAGDETRERLHAHEPRDIEGEWDTLVFAGGLRSANWDGGGDLTAGRDTVATAGFLIDAVSGRAQFKTIYADAGELRTLSVTGTLTLEGSGQIDSITGMATGAGVAGIRLDSGASASYLRLFTSTTAETAAAHVQISAGSYVGATDGWAAGSEFPLLYVSSGRSSDFPAGWGGDGGSARSLIYLEPDRIALVGGPLSGGGLLELKKDSVRLNCRLSSGGAEDGFDISGGNMYPIVDNALSLGTATNSFKNLFTYAVYDESNNLRLDLSGDWDCGGTLTAAGSIYSAGGTGYGILRAAAADTASCSVGFVNDPNTGLVRSAADVMDLVAGGTVGVSVADGSVSVYVGGGLHAVTEGAADSGGAGYKVLRVPN